MPSATASLSSISSAAAWAGRIAARTPTCWSPRNTELSEIARKRLAALREFSDLGAGFKIAALDLELRGAGNLLGGEQHGHISAVGFDMYLKMLEQTVQELKGEETPLEIHSALNLQLDIRIPSEYIADENQRLRAYKRIADARDAEQAEKVRAELADRYGPPPDAVETLVRFAMLKTAAEQGAGIEAIDRRGGAIQIKFHPGSKIDPSKLMSLVAVARRKRSVHPSRCPAPASFVH